jgi:hypothetical protein
MIWFGSSVSPQIIDDLYGVENIDELDIRMVCSLQDPHARPADSRRSDPFAQTPYPPLNPDPKHPHPPRKDRRPFSAPLDCTAKYGRDGN